MNFYCVIPGRVLAPDFGLYRAYIYIPGVTASEDDIILEAVARVSYKLWTNNTIVLCWYSSMLWSLRIGFISFDSFTNEFRFERLRIFMEFLRDSLYSAL